ncbi:hypothetical protein [Mycobacteroides abscessus]|uniref:hypothetical protein n=1 Tax=Mycobacteroides abscessus TaxID=36809 RepID=UPI002106ACEC|nr:hypothetical protein [Mycobacteroides abscessus]
MMRSWVIGLVAASAAALFFLPALVVSNSSTRQHKTRAAAGICSAALGPRPLPTSTVAQLGGQQAAAVITAPVTGAQAAHVLDALYQLPGWRDADPAQVQQWLQQADLTPDSSDQTTATASDSYEARCQHLLQSLTPRQTRRAGAVPLTTAKATTEGLRAAEAAQDALGKPATPTSLLAAAIDRAAVPVEGPDTTVQQALWLGTRVSPAAMTRGDLLLFDFARSGPTQIAIVLDGSTVVAATGLDTPANPAGTAVTGHPPTGPFTVIRLDNPEMEGQR